MKLKFSRILHSIIQTFKQLLQRSTEQGEIVVDQNANVYSVINNHKSVSSVSIYGSTPDFLDGLRSVVVSDDDYSEFQDRLERMRGYCYYQDDSGRSEAYAELSRLRPNSAFQQTVLAEMLREANIRWPWKTVFKVKPHGKNSRIRGTVTVKVWTYTPKNDCLVAELRAYFIEVQGDYASVTCTVENVTYLVQERQILNQPDTIDNVIKEMREREHLFTKDSKWREGVILQRIPEYEEER